MVAVRRHRSCFRLDRSRANDARWTCSRYGRSCPALFCPASSGPRSAAAGLSLTTLAVHRFAFATAARSRPAFALRATVGKQEVLRRQEVPPRPTVAQGALAGKPGALIAVFTASSFAATARPYLVLVFYGQDRAGEMNGVFARPQQLARPVRRPDGGISA